MWIFSHVDHEFLGKAFFAAAIASIIVALIIAFGGEDNDKPYY